MSERWNLHRPREYVHVQLRTGIQGNTVSNRLVPGCLKVSREDDALHPKRTIESVREEQLYVCVCVCFKGTHGNIVKQIAPESLLNGKRDQTGKNDPNGTMHRRKKKQNDKKKNKAELVFEFFPSVQPV